MLTLLEFVQQAYHILSRAPLLVFAAAWLLCHWLRDGRTATRLAMDITFFVLIGSVSELIRQLTGSTAALWIIVFGALLAGGLAGREMERKRGRVDPIRLIIWVTRPGCVILASAYILLWLYMLIAGLAAG